MIQYCIILSHMRTHFSCRVVLDRDKWVIHTPKGILHLAEGEKFSDIRFLCAAHLGCEEEDIDLKVV